ncbi:MAG: polynucleotide adenylyltransferase PcnB [Myxococcales bacterium]
MPPDHEFPAPPDLPAYTLEDPDAPAERGPRHAHTGLVRHSVSLDESTVDADAARVVRRLEKAGYQAYLVGGCVRDLLLGGKPKDFDIATSARPEQVRALFRNCRIIGRRFRLAHVFFQGRKILEVATFRRNPVEPSDDDSDAFDDLLIRSDNVFGEAHEDAIRRDFTINALFYDIDQREVLDWCGGMGDIERRTLQTIGDPWIRFREDPIRILRAIKFAARLDIGIEPEVLDAMMSCRDDLGRAARPRICEELLRLMRGGAAHRSMWMLWETGAMSVLLAAFLDDDEGTAGGTERFFRRMDAVDGLTRRRGALDDITLWCVLLQEPLEEALTGERERLRVTSEFLEPIIARVALPRRMADGIRRIMTIAPRVAAGQGARFARSELLAQTVDVVEIDLVTRRESLAVLEPLRAARGAWASSRTRVRPATARGAPR